MTGILCVGSSSISKKPLPGCNRISVGVSKTFEIKIITGYQAVFDPDRVDVRTKGGVINGDIEILKH